MNGTARSRPSMQLETMGGSGAGSYSRRSRWFLCCPLPEFESKHTVGGRRRLIESRNDWAGAETGSEQNGSRWSRSLGRGGRRQAEDATARGDLPLRQRKTSKRDGSLSREPGRQRTQQKSRRDEKQKIEAAEADQEDLPRSKKDEEGE